jgi:hypothetical protein
VDPNTRAIVELAWARVLKLPDDALMAHPSGRITRVDDSMIMFVTLWEHRVLVAPERILVRAAHLSDTELADGPTLLGLSRGLEPGTCTGRLLGEATLWFADSYVSNDALKSVVVTDDVAAVTDLERLCPPDDIAEVGLSKTDWKFATLDDTDQITAGAGFDEWEQILGHLGVLTPPALRRYGFGTLAAGIATNEALDRGLIPQWRARRDNSASRALAARLGFDEVGSQTAVSLAG